MIFERSTSMEGIPLVPKSEILAAKNGVCPPDDEIIPPGEGSRRRLMGRELESLVSGEGRAIGRMRL